MRKDFSNEAFLRVAKDEKFWKALNPDLHITSRPLAGASPSPALDATLNEKCVRSVMKDGYFHTPPLVARETALRLSCVLTDLEARNIPIVCAFMYDELWQLFVSAHRLLGSLLGYGYQLTPSEVWAFLIPKGQKHAGWGPHRDLLTNMTIRSDNTPSALNVWIPLTDTTPLNGCMHVLPESLDFSLEWGSLNPPPPTLAMLQDVRALPAPAGSVLAWNTRVLHWGGRSSDQAEQPRIAVAMYLQARDLDLNKLDYERPSGPSTVPSVTFDESMELPFPERVRAIGEAMQKYGARNPVRLMPLGKFLMACGPEEEKAALAEE